MYSHLLHGALQQHTRPVGALGYAATSIELHVTHGGVYMGDKAQDGVQMEVQVDIQADCIRAIEQQHAIGPTSKANATMLIIVMLAGRNVHPDVAPSVTNFSMTTRITIIH